MNELVRPVLLAAGQSKLFQVLVVLVVMDVIFGSLRAIKEKRFNSCVGINGMIRKAGMMISLVCLVCLDDIITFNLIGFIPEGIREYLPGESIGIMEFFAVIYIAYEAVSVLKNMALSGLPVGQVWTRVKVFLSANTAEIAELPEDEHGDSKADN